MGQKWTRVSQVPQRPSSSKSHWWRYRRSLQTRVPQMMWKQISTEWKSVVKVKINESLKFRDFSHFFPWNGKLEQLMGVEGWVGYWESRFVCPWAEWAYDSSCPEVWDLSWSLWVVRFLRYFCLDLEGNAGVLPSRLVRGSDGGITVLRLAL